MAWLKEDRSLMIAADVATLDELRRLVLMTYDHPAVSSFKVGLRLVIAYGLTETVRFIRTMTNKPIIYDMQKAATDIPDMGAPFAEACKTSGVDAVILFPMTGPKAEVAFIRGAKQAGLGVVVGGEMTHPGYLDSDGGWIRADQVDRIYTIARDEGIEDFVVPGNKPDRIQHYRELLGPEAAFYSPGLVTQGGSVPDSAKAAGKRWHAIVGRAVYQSENPVEVLTDLAKGPAID